MQLLHSPVVGCYILLSLIVAFVFTAQLLLIIVIRSFHNLNQLYNTYPKFFDPIPIFRSRSKLIFDDNCHYILCTSYYWIWMFHYHTEPHHFLHHNHHRMHSSSFLQFSLCMLNNAVCYRLCSVANDFQSFSDLTTAIVPS